jgi:hypothetical protein
MVEEGADAPGREGYEEKRSDGSDRNDREGDGKSKKGEGYGSNRGGRRGREKRDGGGKRPARDVPGCDDRARALAAPPQPA